MAVFKKKNVQLSSFFEFSDNSDPLDIVDITADPARSSSGIAKFLQSFGSFVYETKFYVDTAKAKSYGVDAIKFDFYTENPRSNSKPIQGASFEIQLETQVQPDVKLGTDSDSFKYSPSMLKRILVSSKTERINRSATNPQLLSTTYSQSPQISTSFSQESQNSLVFNGQDPAKILSAGRYVSKKPSNTVNFGMSNDFVADFSSNFSKISSSTAIEDGVSLARIKNEIEKSQKKLQNSSLSDSLVSQFSDNSSSPSQDFPVFLMNVISKKMEYVRRFYINKFSIQKSEKIYLLVSAKILENFVTDVTQSLYVINHATEIQDFLSNPAPPTVKVLTDTLSRVKFLLTKKDPTLNKVKIVRLIYNPNVRIPLIEDRATIEFESNSDLYFEDDVDNSSPNVVTYRFIAVNADGSYGEFESVVLKSYSKIVDQRKALTATTPISIRASNKVNAIQILVDTLNDKVFTLRLLRQDLGVNDEFSKTVKTVLNQDGEYLTVVNGKQGTFEFFDFDAVPGRHYRYFAAYRIGYENSASICTETISDEDEVIIRVPSLGKETITSVINDATISTNNRGLYSVSFNLDIQESKEIYNVLLQSLERSGVSSKYLEEFKSDTQKQKEAAAFIIERVDRTTGKRVRLGVFPPGDFIDSPDLRNKKSILEIEPGKKYEYVCKLCVRPPETFLQASRVGFVARGSQPETVNQVSALKFSGGLQALYGRLPSERTLRDGLTIEENFTAGQTGVELLIEVDIPAQGAEISRIEVKNKKNYNLISWSTAGNAATISYFLVYVNYGRLNHLLGTVSAIGANATYKFRDSQFAGEVDSKKYYVNAVSVNNDVAIQSSKVETFTESSVPLQPMTGIAVIEGKNQKNSYIQADFSVSDYKLAAEKSYVTEKDMSKTVSAGSFIKRGEDGKLIQQNLDSIFGNDDLSAKMVNSLPFNQVDISNDALNTIENFKLNFSKFSASSGKKGLIESLESKVLPPKGLFNN